MRKFDEGRAGAVRRNDKTEKSSTIDCKIKESERELADCAAIKTLAGARWHEMRKVKDELKAMLPTLKPREVMRHYLPLHEAIIHELEEDGYEISVGYLKKLLELDEEARREPGPAAVIWERPRLRDSKSAMIRLKEGFVVFEQAMREGDPVTATMTLLNMALFFQATTWEWGWVAERLYRITLAKAEVAIGQDDHQQTVTLIRYLYGRFLFEQIQNTAESLDYLEAARKTSENETWNASKVTGQKEGSIFRECNVLLYKALLVHAKQIVHDRPDVAVKAYTEALARATDSGHQEYVVNALHELGKCQSRAGDGQQALQSFSRLLAIAKRTPDPEGELDDEVNTERHLCLLRENTAKYGFTERLAQAHHYTGEHFLSKRKPHVASSHLEKSFNLYNELDLYDDANQTRILAGVSRGQKVIDKYVHLIDRCGKADPEAILMLCRWKDRRSAFWTADKPCIEETKQLNFKYEEFDRTTATPASVGNSNVATVVENTTSDSIA